MQVRAPGCDRVSIMCDVKEKCSERDSKDTKPNADRVDASQNAKDSMKAVTNPPKTRISCAR